MLLNSLSKTEYSLTRWLFLRSLGLVYFFAFCSLSVQIVGLFGTNGILPVSDFLHTMTMHLDISRFIVLPTIFWLNDSDAMLMAVCLLGMFLSVLAIVGVSGHLIFFLLWFLYLSLANIGQDFLSFQWDALLLEAGFLAIFFTSGQWFKLSLNRAIEWPWKINSKNFQWLKNGLEKTDNSSVIIIWLFRWLLFRLMFESGFVKLASGDPTWRNLTALNFHYFTQPLPIPLAWYADKLPYWFNEISVIMVFVIELFVPFLIFAGRKGRIIAAFAIISLQILIAITGNYAYFNLLTVALCLCLFDDQFIKSVSMKIRFTKRLILPDVNNSTDNLAEVAKISKADKFIPIVVAALIVLLSIGSLGRGMMGLLPIPEFLQTMQDLSSGYFICNNYGLFAVMTTKRTEIQIEGSNDGKSWQEYEFKYKPGDLAKAPPVVAPVQPRLDWQMWFAALGDARYDRWFVNLVFRLLQGQKDVLNLLAKNPFLGNPPKYIRARLYDYHFTSASERKRSGNWWKRELIGECMPPVCLNREQER